jgi:hypothetical protein
MITKKSQSSRLSCSSHSRSRYRPTDAHNRPRFDHTSCRSGPYTSESSRTRPGRNESFDCSRLQGQQVVVYSSAQQFQSVWPFDTSRGPSRDIISREHLAESTPSHRPCARAPPSPSLGCPLKPNRASVRPPRARWKTNALTPRHQPLIQRPTGSRRSVPPPRVNNNGQTRAAPSLR